MEKIAADRIKNSRKDGEDWQFHVMYKWASHGREFLAIVILAASIVAPYLQ